MVKARLIAVLFCLLFLTLLVGPVSYGQGGVKSGEILTKENVTKALASGNFCFDVEGYGHFCGSEVEKGSLKVLGVRTDQEAGVATVFYEFIPKKEKKAAASEAMPHCEGPMGKSPVIKGSLTLFRFDDGTWFIPFQDKLVTK